MIAGEIFNIVSAYAPQSGEAEKIKEDVLKDWVDLMSGVPRTEKTVVSIGSKWTRGKKSRCFSKSAWRKGYGQRNREGRNHGKHGEPRLGTSKIDFIMTGRADLKEMRYCKVMPGEEVVS